MQDPLHATREHLSRLYADVDGPQRQRDLFVGEADDSAAEGEGD